MDKIFAKLKGLTYWGPKTPAHRFNNPLYSIVSKLEFLIFKHLLKRFCNKELDQFERWELKSKYGPVYVSIDRQGDGYNYNKLD